VFLGDLLRLRRPDNELSGPPELNRRTECDGYLLILALEEVVGDGFEGGGVFAEGLQRGAGAGG